MNRKIVYKVGFVLLLIGAVVATQSCSTERSQTEKEQLLAKIDSLEKEKEAVRNDLDDMTEFVSILANGLDSIAQQEEILLSNKGKEGVALDREQLRQNLNYFEEMLSDQKNRLAQLSDSLKMRRAGMERLNALVDHLNRQIDEKNVQIRQLRSDLDNKNISIAQLTKRVNALSESNEKLSKRVEVQKEILATQNEIINEGYIKIGTKKALADAGILSGGFLKKKRLNVDRIDKSMFLRVDIRTFTEIPIKSGAPKVLTQMPTSSYRIVRNGENSSTLYVTDATAFWSISNYLVIQTN